MSGIDMSQALLEQAGLVAFMISVVLLVAEAAFVAAVEMIAIFRNKRRSVT